MPDFRKSANAKCRVVVVWIDWYAYHLARFEGLQSALGSNGEVIGLEMVGGVGVHAGLVFREERSADTGVETLLPESNWADANKLTLARLIWSKLDTLQAEIVLVPGYYTLPSIAAAVWAKVHNRQSVLMTESTSDDHKRSRWKEAFKALGIRLLFDWAVTGGTAHVRYLKALGFPADRIVGFYDVVGNAALQGATTSLLTKSAAATHDLPTNYFLFVGRLAPEKNVAGLVRAWLSYRTQGGTWSLVLAGDGPEATHVRDLTASSRYAKDIVFTGHRSAKELVPYFAFATFFVLPSLREPWGLVVNEAMAASLPVIVSNRCGCAEDLVIDSQNGFMFDPREEGQLTACLHKAEQLPSSVLLMMGAASSRAIARFSPENFGRAIASVADASSSLTERTQMHQPSEPNR